MKKVIVFLLFLLNSYFQLHAVSKLDSLLQMLKTSRQDTSKVNLYNKISWLIYIENPAEAKKYGMLAIDLAQKLNFETGLSEALNKMGVYEKTTGNYLEALSCYNHSLEISIKLKDSLAICMLYNNIGNVYKSKGDYAMAISFQIKALKLNEQLKQADGQADGLLNIGLIYDDLKNNGLAMDYLEKSLKVARNINDKRRISRALLNIANIYSDGGKSDKIKALDYYNQALHIDTEAGEKRGQSMCLNNIGAVYFDLGQWKKAEEYYLKSLKIKEETGDRKGKAIINENLAYIEQEKKDYKKAGHYFLIALSIADSVGDVNLKIGLLQSTAENYFLMHDYKLSAETHKTLLHLKDSIFNTEMSQQLTEMQTKYETEKKEKDIILLQKDKQLQHTEIKKQQIVRNTFIIGFILVFILVIVVFRSYSQKKKANFLLASQKKEIEEKNEELNQQNEEITAQRDEIESQRDKLGLQNNLLEEQKQEITDSITYAKRIQNAVFPSEELAKKILGDYFILFKPKNIVSGDFYWATKINNWLIVTVADCTGHGVPGAFMSMLGMSFLNEIVRKKEITKASQVLDHLRESVIEALHQQGTSGEQKDGMDIAICAINMNTLEMQFAGANNPVYIVSSQQSTVISQLPPAAANCQLYELKGDKQPIGIFSNMQPFTNQIFQLQKGDIIYMMSDGFEDQFGGPNRKKFLAKNLKNLLTCLTACPELVSGVGKVANSQLPMANQKQVLETTITEWIGDGEQIDDITILGIKI